jgi:thioredoxin-related protein
MKKIAIISFALVFVFLSAFRNKKTNNMQWQNVEQISQQWQTEKKPILIDLYTDWCHYCKVMEETIYASDSVSNYIRQHFYAAKLNAEDKKELVWMGKKYKYVPKYKVHELAIELTKGSLVYPTTIIIPPTGEPLIVGGARPLNEMESYLKYYGSGENQTKTYAEFNKMFSSKW